MAAAHCATAAATIFFHFPPARKLSVIAYAIPTRFPLKPTKRKNYLRPKILKTLTIPYPIPHKFPPENPFLSIESPPEEQEQQQQMEMEFSSDEFVIQEVKESGRIEEQESPDLCSVQLSNHEVEGSYPVEVQQDYSSGEFSGEEVKDSAPIEQKFASHYVEGFESIQGKPEFSSDKFSGEGMKVFHSDIPFDQFVSDGYGESDRLEQFNREKVEVSEMGEIFGSEETVSSPELVKPIAGNSFSSFSIIQIGFVAACVIDTVWSTWMAKEVNSIKKDQNSSIIDGNNKPKLEHLLNEIKDGNNKPNLELLLKENNDGNNKPSSEPLLKENNDGNNKTKSEPLLNGNGNSIGIKNEEPILVESEMDKKIAEIQKLAREAREKEKLKSEGKGVDLDEDEYGEDDVVPRKLEKSFKKNPVSPEGLAAEEERKTLMFKKRHRLKRIGIDAKDTRPKGLTSTQDHGMAVIKTNGKLQNGPNDNDFVVLNRDEHVNLPRVDLLDYVSTTSLEEEKEKKLPAKETVRKQSSPRKKIVKERAQTKQRVTTSEQLNKSQGDVLGNSSLSLEEDKGKKLPAEESKQIQGSRKKYVKERRRTKPSVTSSELSTVQEKPVSLEAQIFRNFIQSKKHDMQESVFKKRDDLNVQEKSVSLEAQIFRNFIQSKNQDTQESVPKKHDDLNVNGNGKLKVKEVGTGKANNGLGGQKSYDNADFWWLSLPYVLAIVLRNDGGRSAGLYTLRITSQGMDDIIYRVAFEDHTDATNFCHILEDFFEELVGFSAGITSIPTKELEEALKSKNMKVLVVKKGQVKLYAGKPLNDVEKALRSLVNQN